MAGVSSIDITASLNDALAAITGSKVDLGLTINSPFEGSTESMDVNQSLLTKMAEIKKLEAARQQAKATAVRAGVDKGLRAPFETRISGR